MPVWYRNPMLDKAAGVCRPGVRLSRRVSPEAQFCTHHRRDSHQRDTSSRTKKKEQKRKRSTDRTVRHRWYQVLSYQKFLWGHGAHRVSVWLLASVRSFVRRGTWLRWRKSVCLVVWASGWGVPRAASYPSGITSLKRADEAFRSELGPSRAWLLASFLVNHVRRSTPKCQLGRSARLPSVQLLG